MSAVSVMTAAPATFLYVGFPRLVVLGGMSTPQGGMDDPLLDQSRIVLETTPLWRQRQTMRMV